MKNSLKLLPHGLFLMDFEMLFREAERQEQIHSANQGEVTIAMKIKVLFENQIIPLISQSNWVFDAAETFATLYAADCFRLLRLSGREVYSAQRELHEINRRVTEFVSSAGLTGAAPTEGNIELAKASDFADQVDFAALSREMRTEGNLLVRDALDQEEDQLWITLRAIRDLYETYLPRVMYVVRRAIKIQKGIRKSAADSHLMSISQTLDFYEDHVGPEHLLSPVLGNLRSFYKIVRNAGSHHEGLSWDSSTDQVTLSDQKETLVLHVYEFQQRYRLLTYLCEFGLRGTLYAYCGRERGQVCDRLVRQYAKTFPGDFPEGLPGRLRFYVEGDG